MLTILQTYSAGGWRIGYAIFPDTAFGAKVKGTTLAYGGHDQNSHLKSGDQSAGTKRPCDGGNAAYLGRLHD